MNVIGIYIEIFLGGIVVGHHVETALVETDGGGKHAAGAVDILQHNLTFPGENMSNLRPVYQIDTFKKGNPREELEGTADKIKMSVCRTDAWIGIKAFDDGILIAHRISSLFCLQ